MNPGSRIRTVAATIALAVMAGSAAFAQAKMEIVGGDTHDWGKVAPGKLTTVVEVKNAGTEELKIGEVRPACGCTVAPIDKKNLAPGETAKINISLDVTARSGPTVKTITITSNDSSAPSKLLYLKADVHRAITLTPMGYMMVNNAKVGTESEASPMTIKNTGETPFTVDVPKLVDGGNIGVRFDMKDSRTLKPGEEFVLKAFVTPKDASSMFGTLKMKTTSSEMPTVDISITGTMSQPASALPANSAAPKPATAAPQPSGHEGHNHPH